MTEEEFEEAHDALIAISCRNAIELTAIRHIVTRYFAELKGVAVSEIQHSIDQRMDELWAEQRPKHLARSARIVTLLDKLLSPSDERLFSRYIDETLRGLDEPE